MGGFIDLGYVKIKENHEEFKNYLRKLVSNRIKLVAYIVFVDNFKSYKIINGQ